MCGRYQLTARAEALVEHFDLPRLPRFQPAYNIAPGGKILNIVALEDGSLKSVNLFWGLVPSWAKDTKNSGHLINARMETVREKPSFRAAFKQRRCLIPASGFYEWQKLTTGKQAFHIHRTDDRLFAFAGLWEQWQQGREALYSCTILTTESTDVMQPIHHRMPVLIEPQHYRRWLDNTAGPEQAFELLTNDGYAAMTATAVGDWVNNPMHDDPRCLQPAGLMS